MEARDSAMDVPDLSLPIYGVSLAATVLPDEEITNISLSKDQLLSVIEEQKSMGDVTDPGAAQSDVGSSDVPTPDINPEVPERKLQSLDLSRGSIEDVNDDHTDPGVVDPALERVSIGDAPTNVVAKGTDLTQLARKVKKVKRRRSLFRR